jgi:hypothetical protein
MWNDPAVTWLGEPQFVNESAVADDAAGSGRRAAASGVDWSRARTLRTAQDQGTCGSCWAFSGTHALDDQLTVENLKWSVDPGRVGLPSSVQDPLECAGAYGSSSCAGGPTDAALKQAFYRGAVTESCKPYTAIAAQSADNQHCQPYCRYGGQYAPSSRKLPAIYYEYSIAGIKSRLASGVGVIGIQTYASFVNAFLCGTNVYAPPGGRDPRTGGHGMEVVGWGRAGDLLRNGPDRATEDYWIVKNSWGAAPSCPMRPSPPDSRLLSRPYSTFPGGYAFLSIARTEMIWPAVFPRFNARSRRQLQDGGSGDVGNVTNDTPSDQGAVVEFNETAPAIGGEVTVDNFTSNALVMEAFQLVLNVTAPVCSNGDAPDPVPGATPGTLLNVTVQSTAGVLFTLRFRFLAPADCASTYDAYIAVVLLDGNATLSLVSFTADTPSPATHRASALQRLVAFVETHPAWAWSVVGVLAAPGVAYCIIIWWCCARHVRAKQQLAGKTPSTGVSSRVLFMPLAVYNAPGTSPAVASPAGTSTATPGRAVSSAAAPSAPAGAATAAGASVSTSGHADPIPAATNVNPLRTGP